MKRPASKHKESAMDKSSFEQTPVEVEMTSPVVKLTPIRVSVSTKASVTSLEKEIQFLKEKMAAQDAQLLKLSIENEELKRAVTGLKAPTTDQRNENKLHNKESTPSPSTHQTQQNQGEKQQQKKRKKQKSKPSPQTTKESLKTPPLSSQQTQVPLVAIKPGLRASNGLKKDTMVQMKPSLPPRVRENVSPPTQGKRVRGPRPALPQGHTKEVVVVSLAEGTTYAEALKTLRSQVAKKTSQYITEDTRFCELLKYVVFPSIVIGLFQIKEYAEKVLICAEGFLNFLF
ncbi:hypothetical protein PGB90_002800 [Kerria lacca]